MTVTASEISRWQKVKVFIYVLSKCLTFDFVNAIFPENTTGKRVFYLGSIFLLNE